MQVIGDLKMVKKFPSALCGRITYFIKDEGKATKDYIKLRRRLSHAFTGKYAVIAGMSRQEAQHRRNLVKIFNAKCRR